MNEFEGDVSSQGQGQGLEHYTSLLVKCCKNEQIKRRIPPPWRPIPHFPPPSDPSPCKVLF